MFRSHLKAWIHIIDKNHTQKDNETSFLIERLIYLVRDTYFRDVVFKINLNTTFKSRKVFSFLGT